MDHRDYVMNPMWNMRGSFFKPKWSFEQRIWNSLHVKSQIHLENFLINLDDTFYKIATWTKQWDNS